MLRRLSEDPLTGVYAWLQRQPVPSASVEAARHHQWLGQMAMQLTDYSAAVEHFEAAVLANPYALGSRLELAIAYTELGNESAARASLRGLEAYRGETPLPPAAARTLAQLETRLSRGQSSTAGGWSSALQGTVTAAQGYDSNANLGSRHRTIPLNLFDMIADEAVLADASRAQSSRYSRFGLTANLPAGLLLPGSDQEFADWRLLAGMGAQRYHDLNSLHRRDAYLGVEWQRSQDQRLSTMLQHQDVDGIGTAWYLDADFRQLLAGDWMAQAGLQWQREPVGRQSQRLSIGLWRQWGSALMWGSASWQHKPDRPAGDTWRLRMGAQSPTWHWRALEAKGYMHLMERHDTEPYNYVFFGDQRRRETTATLGARASLPLMSALDLVVDARWEKTCASLELFDTDRWSLEAALEWHW